MTEINDLIGRPWRLGARGPDAFDCWGLVLELARRSGHVVPADWDVGNINRAQQRVLMAEQSRARTLRVDSPVDGALAYSERAAHVGYVLHGRVVHAARNAGVVSWSLGMWSQAFPDCGWYLWHA